TPWIERGNPRWLRPLREWTDRGGRVGIRQIGTTNRVERARRHRESTIKRVRSAMAADDIAVLRLWHCANDRTARTRTPRAPMDWKTRLSARLRMGGETNVIGSVGSHKGTCDEKAKLPARWQADSHACCGRAVPDDVRSAG